MNNERETQLGRTIYHRFMAIMKFTLDMEEYSYAKDKGRADPRYKFFKKQLMSETYKTLRELLSELEENGLLTKTEYSEDVKDGYQDTASGGSGYLNSDQFNGWIKREKAKNWNK